MVNDDDDDVLESKNGVIDFVQREFLNITLGVLFLIGLYFSFTL